MTEGKRQLLRKGWRAVPLPARLKRRMREAVRRRLDALVTPRLDRSSPVGAGPILVAGYHSATLGLGRAARMVAAALEARDVAIRTVDVTDITVHASSLPHGDRGAILDQGGPLLAVVNAPETPRMLQRFGPAALRGRHRIGYWTWELPTLPADWAAVARYLHELWVPSAFAFDAIRSAVDIPVRMVPYPVAALIGGDLGPAIPPDDPGNSPFTVLSMFDARSSLARKNPQGAVAAFTRALGGRRDARLLLKASNLDPAMGWWREIADLAAVAGNVSIVTETLDDAAIAGLIARADVVLSLHRSEGFGLPLAEAMCCGRAVMATGWSGNMSFMSATNSLPVPYRLVEVEDPQGIYRGGGQYWAEPDLDAAATLLGELYRDRGRCRALGAAGRRDALAQFSVDAFWSNLPESMRHLSIGSRTVGAAGYAPSERRLDKGEW